MLLIFAAFGYKFGAPITLESQWTFFEALRTTTSIAFGVMGALIALVYPDIVKNAFRGGANLNNTDGGLRTLIAPCGHSAVLLVILVALAPVVAWVLAISPTLDARDIATLRKISFSVLCALSFWQISILLMVLLPFSNLYTQVSTDIRRERLRRAMHNNGGG